MNFLCFFFSKLFLWQLLYLGLASTTFFFLVSVSLREITNHNDYQKVPNLRGVTLSAIPAIMEEQNFRFEVIDSTKFVPELPPLSIISHLPLAEREVKKNRKIYLTVNPSNYRKITVPNLIQITRRNAESIIKSVGFEVGEITYKNDIGKDMVLEIRYQGNKINPGILLPKTTKIDLVLGNGRR
ncbi:MAG: beta-lactam-binding protein with PASTA domain [Flavobacteriaceae bacterium]|jgi:beta-lactam-binding protein with PASTA domain|tara:strand:- start:3609 stop:4160 length:552 start_codon:yes stop_codon:yes gene_type:complete